LLLLSKGSLCRLLLNTMCDTNVPGGTPKRCHETGTPHKGGGGVRHLADNMARE
jgi:hypothetical protein